jgi:hypothetical protein
MGLAEWRSEFGAAPAELADLLQFVRNPAGNVGQALLDGSTVHVPCSFNDEPSLPASSRLATSSTLSHPGRSSWSTGGVVGQLHSSVHTT